MWIRRRLDIGWKDLVYGILQCFLKRKEAYLLDRIKNQWPHPEQIIPVYSVRTGFDLLFKILDLPPGSEVLVSAITLPDMVRIIEKYSLTAVPVDINLNNMGCSKDLFLDAITPATRAVVITNLFGGCVPADDIVDISKQKGLIVIEDCAQSFRACTDDGHPGTDISMFSFGTIKTATALGGAVLIVRNREIRENMVEKYASYPVQSRMTYLFKLLKYTFLKILTYRVTFGMLVRLLNMFRIDYDSLIHKWSRGFPGPDFFELIRRKPSVPLLAMLGHRLSRYDYNRFADQRKKGKQLISLVGEKIECPGCEAENHVYWVFPVSIENKEKAVALLRENGFDATEKHSMYVVPVPEGKDVSFPDRAGKILESIVYLPFYPELPMKEIKRMGELLSTKRLLNDNVL